MDIATDFLVENLINDHVVTSKMRIGVCLEFITILVFFAANIVASCQVNPWFGQYSLNLDTELPCKLYYLRFHENKCLLVLHFSLIYCQFICIYLFVIAAHTVYRSKCSDLTR